MKSDIWMAVHDLRIIAWKHTFNYLNQHILAAPYGTQIVRELGTLSRALSMESPRSQQGLSPGWALPCSQVWEEPPLNK